MSISTYVFKTMKPDTAKGASDLESIRVDFYQRNFL